MRLVLMCLTIIFSVVVSSSAQAQVIAKVGNVEITQKDFDEKYALIQEQLIDVPDRKTLLNDLISFEVGVQEAYKKGLDKDPIVKDRMKQELYKGFIEKELGPKVAKMAVSEAEMKEYYARYPEIRTSHIMVEIRPDATAPQKAQARARSKEIFAAVSKGGKKFEDFVKLYSDDVMSNNNGGDIGWQTRLTHYPSLYRTAVKLKIGQTSNVVETPFGLFIIKLTGKKSYAEADHSMLRLAVQEEKKKRLFDGFIQTVRGKYNVQITKGFK
ncbi:MAG: peptidylprolyl isomerase [Bdellovibrionaceae bacterium]|nr:peptidylprolyl isomerase [Pseudobdellovibrionaceae bacterium]